MHQFQQPQETAAKHTTKQLKPPSAVTPATHNFVAMGLRALENELTQEIQHEYLRWKAEKSGEPISKREGEPILESELDLKTHRLLTLLMQRMMGEIGKTQFAECLIAFHKFTLDSNPFQDLADAFLARAMPPPPPQFPKGGKPPPSLGGTTFHEMKQFCWHVLIGLLWDLIRKWPDENRFFGYGTLWHIAMDDQQFKQLAGLAGGRGSVIDEVEKYDLNSRMTLSDACIKLGLGSWNESAASLQKRFVRCKAAQEFIVFERDERTITMPTIYFVKKSEKQIANLKAMKKKICGLELKEEPIIPALT